MFDPENCEVLTIWKLKSFCQGLSIFQFRMSSRHSKFHGNVFRDQSQLMRGMVAERLLTKLSRHSSSYAQARFCAKAEKEECR